MFSGFFFSKLFYKQSTFCFKRTDVCGRCLHSFSQHSPDTHPRVGGEFPDNSVFKRQNLLSIKWFKIQPSKTKTFCQNHQNLLSKHQNHQNHLSKSSKTSKPAIIYYTAFKNKNLMSKSSKPAVKTSKPPVKIIKNIKTCCHLLYSLQKQKPSVKIIKNIKTCCQDIKTIKTCCQNIKTIKTTCQNHQNLLSITSKPSKPPVKNIKTYCHYNMID